jgi:hypothetical protein
VPGKTPVICTPRFISSASDQNRVVGRGQIVDVLPF